FFFQAEDGIRDRTVTGVQTCALPILRRTPASRPPKRCPACGTPTVKPESGVWTICPNRAGCAGQVLQHVKHFVGALDIDGLGERSEERRVGKEWRCRWAEEEVERDG